MPLCSMVTAYCLECGSNCLRFYRISVLRKQGARWLYLLMESIEM